MEVPLAARPDMLSLDEAEALAAATRAVCERLAPEDRIREIAYERDATPRRGFDDELWMMLCTQIGITTIAVSQHLGGAGCGVSALGVVGRELGRALAPVPFLASVVLATGLVLDVVGGDDPGNLGTALAPLLAGERTAAAALTRDGGARVRGDNPVMARPDARDEWVLTGSARHVLHAAAADDLVVSGTHNERTGIFLLAADSPGVTREIESVLDPTRPMATVEFHGARATRIDAGGCAEELIDSRTLKALAVLSAEQVGANERLLELAVDHATSRHQFGRPIGSFQAVKHRCADMLVELEWSRSASQAAMQSADDEPVGTAAELRWRARMAKAVCSESLRAASHSNLQIRGGIGFTWEDSAHLYLKRARTDEVLFGTPAEHWDKFAAEAGLS
ncbi:MAG: acyl-CoA dehydrogenase family protein [Mycobacterium sp.]|nr:acyl-CoA dehydrogenase family protein [Mycobacterium sp.]